MRNNKMYNCEICARSFSRKFNLNRHSTSAHRNKPVFAQATQHGMIFNRSDNEWPQLTNKKFTPLEEQTYDEGILKWKHPFTCMLAGPTQCGKSTFVARFLQNLEHVVASPICEVIYCAPKNSYPDTSGCKVTIRYLDWVPDEQMFADKKPRLIIIDDMMRESNEHIIDMFTKHSHHLGLSVIFVTQNIFHKGKGIRDISLNSHYIVAYKSPRDRGQFSTLARQICPQNIKFANEVFDDATKEPYGYLVMDLTQTTPDHLRFRTHIFPNDNPPYIVYVPKTFQG